MKKLLIIGASVLQLPAIKTAKALGYEVAVVDYDPNAVGIPYADRYFNVSTIDAAGVTAAARAFQPDGIMTLATDMPMRSVAAACEALGLPGVTSKTALQATDKAEMIRAFEAAGVAHPWYFVVSQPKALDAVIDRISFPCISKPVDNSGSRGVMLIHNAEELRSAVRYSAENGRGGAVIVEEYLTGAEVSVEVMAISGEIHVLQVTDKLTTGAPHFVEMGHSQPSRLPAADVAAIRALAVNAVRAVGITDGPAHVEIMNTPAGPKMIELGARMGGDCITTHLVPLSTGIDMIRATIDVACGQRPDITRKFEKGSAIRYFDAPCGVLKSINGVAAAEAIPGVQEITFVKAVGARVGEIGSSGDRIGFVIAQAETPEEAVVACEQALQTVRISVEQE